MANTPSQLIDITTRHQVFLERLKTGEADKILPVLRQIDRDIRDRLTRRDITTMGRARYERLLDGVDEMLRDVFGDYIKDTREGLLNIARSEAEWSVRELDRITMNFEPVMPTVQQIRSAALSNPLGVEGPAGGKMLTPFLQRFGQNERDRITSAMRIGYFQGETDSQIIRRLRGPGGVYTATERSARAVVRTGIQHMSSVARAEAYRANDDIVKGYRWVSTLDARTSSVCQALDGRVYKLGEGPMPPAHPNCRSSTAPELDARFSALRGGAQRPAVGPDGVQQAPAKETYYGWLKRQPADFQNEAIGPTRAKLLRDGNLSADRFSRLQLDRNFQPLTLERMKELEPLAFKNAGLD